MQTHHNDCIMPFFDFLFNNTPIVAEQVFLPFYSTLSKMVHVRPLPGSSHRQCMLRKSLVLAVSSRIYESLCALSFRLLLPGKCEAGARITVLSFVSSLCHWLAAFANDMPGIRIGLNSFSRKILA